MTRPALVAWALIALFGLLTFVTYARLPAEETYNVSREGMAAGASRTLVFLNFPGAFVAIGVLLVCLERLRGRAAWLAGAGIVLCAVAAWPGVLDQDDLDARWINAVPALGVAVAAVVTVLAVRSGGAGARDTLSRERARVAAALALGLIAVPWLFAEAGFYAPDPIYADEVPPGESERAVHLGGHHGTYGVILAVSALALSRSARGAAASVYLAFLLAYGCAIAAEDFWHEQIDKRGAVDWTFPSLLEPELEWGWLALVVAGVAIEVLWFRRERRPTRRLPAPARARPTP